MNDDCSPKVGRSSRLVHIGRSSSDGSAVNPPIERASTYLYGTVEAMRDVEASRAKGQRTRAYGRRGSETGFHLEDALVEMEQGYRARLASSGLAANVLVFLSTLKTGDHAIVSDGVYGPVRKFAASALKRHGVDFDFCRADGTNVEALLRENTRLIYLEVPGSVLFEIADLPRIASLAKAAGAWLAVDNTWASGWLYRPLTLGADISVVSATKYLNGHSDVLLGAVVSNEAAWPLINDMAELTGVSASPDDAYQVLRGIRTLGVRMEAHAKHASRLIDWFKAQPFVRRTYYPASPDHDGFDLWQRDFTGASGLFSIELEPEFDEQRAIAFVNALQMFGIGSSWGGFESLVRLENASTLRSASTPPAGQVIRFHAGLEDVEDLLHDVATASQVLVR